MPLETFVFVGTFIEELVSPIPSLIVMVPAGVAAAAQGETLLYLVFLAAIAAAARVIAGSLLYFAADKIEDLIFAKGRTLFGASHKKVEDFGKKLGHNHTVKTWFVLLALSALPFLPTATLSLACGFVKIRYDIFVTTTFLGSIICGFFYLYVGYVGLEAAKIIGKLDSIAQVFSIAALLLFIAWIIWRGLRRKKKS